MTIAVIDVGSNTVRLLVATARPARLVLLREEKAFLGLGAEILRKGLVGAAKLEEAAEILRRYARIARKLGAERVEIVVTAPGRQAANPEELADALTRAARAPVRILSAEEEGLLAYHGAVAQAARVPKTVAVCDTGGGSTELVVGAAERGPVWIRSVDLGSLRLTTQFIESDPPTRHELDGARREARRLLAGIVPPRAQGALAVGGSARGLARLVGMRLDEVSLDRALKLVSEHRAGKVAKAFRLEDERARVLPAAAIILGELARTFGLSLELVRGGLREGLALELLAEAEAA
jgi:exopolyphosphatase/guanosine-5'-triphosphate,3'-diphosphate pyrophosphatase